jgi:hypothetical protein
LIVGYFQGLVGCDVSLVAKILWLKAYIGLMKPFLCLRRSS